MKMDSSYIAHLRQMAPGKKFQEIIRLHSEEITRLMAHLQTEHADWSEERLRREAGCLCSCGVSVAEFERRNAADKSGKLWVT